jgi:hypothetical protein
MDWSFVLVVLGVAAFFGLIAWLRMGGTDELKPPGEPGDADKFSKLDGS